jgi:hypothetical protein
MVDATVLKMLESISSNTMARSPTGSHKHLLTVLKVDVGNEHRQDGDLICLLFSFRKEFMLTREYVASTSQTLLM